MRHPVHAASPNRTAASHAAAATSSATPTTHIDRSRLRARKPMAFQLSKRSQPTTRRNSTGTQYNVCAHAFGIQMTAMISAQPTPSSSASRRRPAVRVSAPKCAFRPPSGLAPLSSIPAVTPIVTKP